MAAQGLSQKEYLKKYLSSGTDERKKKKKGKHNKAAEKGLRIVDDDIDLKNMRPLEDNELDLYHLAEDAPQIAGIVDERPDELRTLEEFGSKRWKVISDENGIEDIKVTAIKRTSEISTVETRDSLGGELKAKKQRLGEDSDKSPIRKQMVEISSDESPHRKPETHIAHTSSLKEGNFESGEAKRYRIQSDSRNSHKRVGRNQRGGDANDLSPRRLKRHDSDESPPRKSRRKDDSSELNPQRPKGGNNSDESPPRNSRRKDDSDGSPPRKSSRKDDSDESPPRRSKREDYSEQSLKKINRKDQSPPRKLKRKGYSPLNKSNRKDNIDHSPPRKPGRHYNTNVSPLRKDKSYDDSDDSPSGRLRHVNETSPKNGDKQSKSYISHDSMRRLQQHGEPSRRLHDSNSSHSPHRYTNKSCISSTKKTGRRDSSPVIKSGKPTASSRDRKNHNNNNSDESPTRHSGPYKSSSKMSSGSDSDVSLTRKPRKNEVLPNRLKQQRPNHSMYRSWKHSDSDESPTRRLERRKGGSQESRTKVERTLDGRKAGLQDAKELKREIEDLKHRESEMFAKMDASVSGKGAAPVMRDRKTGKRRDLEQEAKEKMEEDKKTAEHKVKYTRWGKGLKQVEDQEQKLQQDLYEMSKPLARYAGDEDLEKHLRDQEREGDPMLQYIRSKAQDVSVKGKPKYQGSFLPNRFGIPPGHRWDGVDRSSGYEKQWFEQLNAKRAMEDEAYKWSTSDM